MMNSDLKWDALHVVDRAEKSTLSRPFPSLLGIFNQTEDIQRAMLKRASIGEVFHFYCHSEEGKRLVLREPLPQNCKLCVSVNPEQLLLQVFVFETLREGLTFKHELPGPGVENTEFPMERQFDDVKLQMCRKDIAYYSSFYYIRSANMREDFGKLIDTFQKIFGTDNSNVTIGYHFEETVVTETVQTEGSMPVTPDNLNYLLDYCMGYIPQTHILLNDEQSTGLALRSEKFEQKNSLASVDSVIGFLENILRPAVWRDLDIDLYLDKDLLEGKEETFFRALDKFHVPNRVFSNENPERVKKISNFFGSIATITIHRQSDFMDLLEEPLEEDEIHGDLLIVCMRNDGVDRDE